MKEIGSVNTFDLGNNKDLMGFGVGPSTGSVLKIRIREPLGTFCIGMIEENIPLYGPIV